MPRGKSLALSFCEQLLVERHLDTPTSRAEPDRRPHEVLARLPQTQGLQGELHALGQRRLGAAPDGSRLVLDNGHRTVFGELDRVASAGQIEAFGANVDRA